MKKAAIAIVIVFLMVFSVQTFAAEKIKIATLEWQPYAGENGGSSLEILRDFLNKKGYQVEFQAVPWGRIAIQAKEPGFVGYYPCWPSEVQKGFESSPELDISSIAIMKKEDKQINEKISLEELFKTRLVGLVRDYGYPEEILKLAEKYEKNVIYTLNDERLTRMLDAGRFYAAISDPDVIFYYAKKNKIDSIRMVRVLEKKPLVMAINPEQEKLIKDLNGIRQKGGGGEM